MPLLPFADRVAGRRTGNGRPYAFGLLLGDLDLHLFNEGRHFHLADALGANVATIDGVTGVRFAVWAPGAERVAVIGDFIPGIVPATACGCAIRPVSGRSSCPA